MFATSNDCIGQKSENNAVASQKVLACIMRNYHRLLMTLCY